MFDLFGSKRKAILALPDFQKSLVFANDIRFLIHSMSDTGCFINITPDKDANIASAFSLTFSTTLTNSLLRYALNDYYSDFCLTNRFHISRGSFSRSNLSQVEIEKRINDSRINEEKIRERYLSNIRQALFKSPDALALYTKYQNSNYFDIYDLLYNCFGIGDSSACRYIASDDEHIPFTWTLPFRTGLSNSYPNGKVKPKSVLCDEINYYTTIFLNELKKQY